MREIMVRLRLIGAEGADCLNANHFATATTYLWDEYIVLGLILVHVLLGQLEPST